MPASPGKPAPVTAEDEEEVDVLGDADCNGGSGSTATAPAGAVTAEAWRRPRDDSGATDLRTGQSAGPAEPPGE